MARTRPGLEIAVLDILRIHGVDGRRMSLRQAERLTGLSPATIGELAKGNARTPETLLRFANGLGEDADRLLLLAGFVPDRSMRRPAPMPSGQEGSEDIAGDEREWLGRFGRALAKMPSGRERGSCGEDKFAARYANVIEGRFLALDQSNRDAGWLAVIDSLDIRLVP